MTSKTPDAAAIFEIARHISSEEVRDDYLQQACGNETALHSRVLALLDAFQQQPDFLDVTQSRLEETENLSSVVEMAGTIIGKYKLMEQIGEGGMGVVFVAEQQRPIRRKVALKVIKPGMDTKEVVARFEAERQALALMNHPHIAKVLDAGTTDSGRP